MSQIISGRFEWNELWTVDAAAASRFYAQIFPWTAQVWDKDTGYTLFIGKSIPEAGCHTLSADDNGPHIKPRWNTYISASDVDSLVSKATALGGTVIVPAMEIPRVGRFAMLKDPQGAAFGLLCRSVSEPPRAMPPPNGAMVWNELLTSDAEAAFKFYAEIFGWELITRINMGPKGYYLILGDEGVQRGGMMTVALPGGPQWLAYTEVESVDKTAAMAVKAGATLCLGPQDIPGGRIANLIDPQGVMFAIHSPLAAMTATSEPTAAVKAAAASSPQAGASGSRRKIARKTQAKRKRGTRSASKSKAKRSATRTRSAPRARKKAAQKVAKRTMKRGAKRVVKKSKKKAPRAAPKRGSRRGARRR